ncbi:ribonuclease P protein component [Aerococcus urinaehominis]|uniref:Ribonuclease P protein component n=1 Tax=Aerococcus urinaehominis TaxID=128944 RepID=A0A109RHE3_9LACT|nr:ribonuclease P protein component [Aerococcus urinaehominis]AMC00045.1 ribonuclease P protein component [Aerococcus urinaehominis]
MRKSYRIKRESDFSLVYHQGENTANRQFVVYQLSKEQKHFRIGISVGKKIGNAVTRNYVKRRIRQAIYELKDDLRQDVDFIIIARKPSANMSQHEIKQSLIHVLKLSKLLVPKDA